MSNSHDLQPFFSRLPSAVAWSATPGTDGPAELYPSEQLAVQAAVPERQAEFATGRQQARLALMQLGVRPAPIPVGPQREPLWPGGFTGSISHCGGLCMAAVARQTCCASLGIDVETNKPLPEEVAPLVLTELERQFAIAQSYHATTLIFSAKESLFKCLFPRVQRYIEFHEAEITIDAPSQSLFCRLEAPLDVQLSGRLISGAYYIGNGFLFTAFWLAPAPVG